MPPTEREGILDASGPRVWRDNLEETRASIWMRFYVAVSATVSALLSLTRGLSQFD